MIGGGTGSGHSSVGGVASSRGTGIVMRIAQVLEGEKSKEDDDFEALSVVDVKPRNSRKQIRQGGRSGLHGSI